MDNLILSQIPLGELMERVRAIIREELGSCANNEPRELEIIDRKELCKRLGITEPTARLWQKKGKIPAIQVGGNYRYNYPKVIEALERQKSKK